MALEPNPLIPGNSTGVTTTFASLRAEYGGMPSAGSGGAGSAPMVPDEPLVYIGTKKVDTPLVGTSDWTPREWEQNQSTTKVGKSVTLSRALRKFDKMSIAEQKKMYRLLLLAGFGGAIDLADIDEVVEESSQLEARSAYKVLLNTASEYHMDQGLSVTPEDVLRSHIAYRLQGSGLGWNGKFSTFDDGVEDAFRGANLDGVFGPSVPEEWTVTSKSTDIDYMNPQDAKALTRAMLQQELGRDPTKGEYEDFLSAIMAAERENPTTTKTTTHYKTDAAGNTYIADQSSVSRGGMTEAGYSQLLQNQAQSQPGWAEWQAMGTYAPALFAALGSTVPGV